MNNKELLFMDALVTSDLAGAIERSEKREQNEVVRKQRLPLKTNEYNVPKEYRTADTTQDMDFKERFKIMHDNNKKWTKEQYEKMGIKIIDEYDDLFLNVILPEGWEIKPTEHSMWNEVVDGKGRKRMTFFYKGAFYDRDAFSTFERRFTYSQVPFDEYKTDATYEERNSKEWYGIVYDCGKEIFRTKGLMKKDNFNNDLEKLCVEFLMEKYELWEDVHAYWNE